MPTQTILKNQSQKNLQQGNFTNLDYSVDLTLFLFLAAPATFQAELCSRWEARMLSKIFTPYFDVGYEGKQQHINGVGRRPLSSQRVRPQGLASPIFERSPAPAR